MIVQQILEKLYSPKIIYGKFQAKDNNSQINKAFKLSKGEMYPNGRIKEYNDSLSFQFDFKIKYVENKREEVLGASFKETLKQMCFSLQNN